MGAGYSVPQSVESMATDTTKQFSVVIEYCGAWGYSSQANFASNVIRGKYPLAKVHSFSPGKTGNIIVKVNGSVVWEKNRGDGPINGSTIQALMNKVKAFVEQKWWQTNETKGDAELKWMRAAKAAAVARMTELWCIDFEQL